MKEGYEDKDKPVLDDYSFNDIRQELKKYAMDKSFANAGKSFQLEFPNLLIGKDAGGSIKIIKLENGRQTKPTEWFDSIEKATEYIIDNAEKGKYDSALVRKV